MNQFEKLFIPKENGDIEINKVELRRHVYLKSIINKPTTQENITKLMYIYLMSDIGSMYNHLNGEEKHNAVKEHLGFENHWKPQPDLSLAVDAYARAMELSATGRAYQSTVKGVYESGKDMDRIMDHISTLKEQLETRMNKVKNDNAFTETEKVININEARGYMNEIISTQKTLLDNIKALPPLLKIVDELSTKFAEESSKKQEIHGGGELGNRE